MYEPQVYLPPRLPPRRPDLFSTTMKPCAQAELILRVCCRRRGQRVLERRPAVSEERGKGTHHLAELEERFRRVEPTALDLEHLDPVGRDKVVVGEDRLELASSRRREGAPGLDGRRGRGRGRGKEREDLGPVPQRDVVVSASEMPRSVSETSEEQGGSRRGREREEGKRGREGGGTHCAVGPLMKRSIV